MGRSRPWLARKTSIAMSPSSVAGLGRDPDVRRDPERRTPELGPVPVEVGGDLVVAGEGVDRREHPQVVAQRVVHHRAEQGGPAVAEVDRGSGPAPGRGRPACRLPVPTITTRSAPSSRAGRERHPAAGGAVDVPAGRRLGLGHLDRREQHRDRRGGHQVLDAEPGLGVAPVVLPRRVGQVAVRRRRLGEHRDPAGPDRRRRHRRDLDQAVLDVAVEPVPVDRPLQGLGQRAGAHQAAQPEPGGAQRSRRRSGRGPSAPAATAAASRSSWSRPAARRATGWPARPASRWAVAVSAPVSSAPALVPTSRLGRGPRAAMAGSSTPSAPTW